jgi:HK97 family phage portal protein
MANRLTRWWERRSLATPPPELLSLFNSGSTESGQTVNAQTALNVPAVFACCQVLSQDIARTPIRFRQQTATDTFEDAPTHPLAEILGSLPNPETTSYQFQFALMWQLLLYGRAYAEIVRVDGRVVALWPLLSESMRVDRTPARQKRWTYTAGAERYVWLFDASAPPILELTTETPILRCKEVIGSALALQMYVAKFFANGAKPAGIITVAGGGITAEQAQRLRDTWTANYAGTANRWKIPVLDAQLKFDPIQMENDSAQLNETQRALNEQIAGAFRVPVSKIGDLSKANYSNMEISEQVYVNSTLDPYYRAFELALKRDLLTVRQYGQFDVQFDRAALTRNDTKALHAALCQGIQNGIYSQNDARRKLGENPIPDGDTYLINSALQPVGTPKEVPVVA